MSRRLAAAAALTFGTVVVAARGPALPAPDVPLPPAGVLAVTGVTLIDGTGAAPRPGTTVLIRDGRIVAVGADATVAIPPDALVMDGDGAYMIPGLWDMHAHAVLAEPQGQVYRRLLVAFGVTGTRVMEEQLRPAEIGERPEPAADLDLIGPRVVRSGRVVNGPGSVSETVLVVRDARDGAAVLDSLRQGGSDFVKVYNLVGREAFFALLAEARRRGVPVAGHVPFAVAAGEASDSGQASIEHLTGVLLDCSSRALELRREIDAALVEQGSAPAPRALASVQDRTEKTAGRTYDAGRCEALARRFARNGTVVTPTLVMLRRAVLHSHADELYPEYFPLIAPGWADRLAERVETARRLPLGERARRDSLYDTRLHAVGLMARAGVAVLAGTDAPADFVVPGISLHEELELLVEAGLDPAAALRAATLAPARYLGAADSLGTIETGKVADLVLLDGDPLADIYNTRRIRAVILRGRLLDRERLHRLRAEARTLVAARSVPAAAAGGRRPLVSLIDALLPGPSGR